MKQKSSSSLSKKSVIAFAAILIAAGCYFIYLQLRGQRYEPKYEPSTTKETPRESVKEPDKTPSTDLPKTSEDVPKASVGTIAIADLSQQTGFVNVSAVAKDFAPTKCVYQFTSPNARPVIKEIDGNCKPLSIPQNEFEKIGTYTLVVTAYSNSEKISASKDIAIH